MANFQSRYLKLKAFVDPWIYEQLEREVEYYCTVIHFFWKPFESLTM